MKCSRCDHENPSALKFCGECGARLAAVCAACGANNAPEQEFCGECNAKLGMRPLVAHCHFGLGKLYRQTSRRTQTREHLTTATALYREMDMRFWLEKAQAEVSRLAH